MLRCAKERQILRFRCSCLESTHLNGAPRDRPVHIIADNEVPIQHRVLLLLRLLLLGECRLEPDMCLEEQSKLKLKGTAEHSDNPLCVHFRKSDSKTHVAMGEIARGLSF